MPIIRLTFQQPSAIRPGAVAPSVLNSANLIHSYFPAKGIPLSICIHAVLFCLLIFLRPPRALPIKIRQPQRMTVIERNEPRVVMYLPLIGGGSFGFKKPSPMPKTKARFQKAPTAAASKPKGFSYPGRQEIVSNPPDPTNQIQTLQQPALENPPILPPPLLLPNIVQIAENRTEQLPQSAVQDTKKPEQIMPVEPPPSRPSQPVKPAEPAPSRPPQQIKPPEPPPVKSPEPPKAEAPIPEKPPEKPKPVEPPPPKSPEVPKPVEPPPAKTPEPPKPAKPSETPKPAEPPQVRPPVIEPPLPPADPMILPTRMDLPKAIDIPKVAQAPLFPPPPAKAPQPVKLPDPPPSVPKQEAFPVIAPTASAKPVAKVVSPKKNVSAVPKETVQSKRADVEAAKTEPAAKAAESPRTQTPNAAGSSSAEGGADRHDLLALAPMPAPAGRSINIPRGEARGRFAISPEPNLDASETELGSKAGVPIVERTPDAVRNTTPRKGSSSSENAFGNEPSPAVVNIGSISNTAKSKAAPKSKENGSGPNFGQNGNSKGGLNSGQHVDSGSGSGPGKKRPFSGISIVGGSYDPGIATDAAPVVQVRRPIQTSYGLTVISTESSGGGLPFVGVFSGEQIYTVYLDMRRDESDTAPSWTLEFALAKHPDMPEGNAGDAARNQEGLVLPFPITKDPPAFAAELNARYRGRMVIVYGIINTEGKIEQISVKDSPDPQFNEPLIRALAKWSFRPAQFKGSPAAVKVLMGIPLR